MQTELLVKILNSMPPQQLGQLMAQVQNPQAYLSGGMFDQRGAGYRGTLPVQMRNMQSAVGGSPANAIRTY